MANTREAIKPKRKDGYWFDQAKVDHVIEWIQTFCCHAVGDKSGEPLILPEWFKKDIITPMFGWKKPDGKRRYQECYELIGSGNAKSTLGTALALYCLCADGQQSPRVYCVASSKEQAGIIFNACKIMVQASPELSSEITILRNSLTIENKNGLGILMAISADSDTNEGLNPTAIFMDELHTQPNDKLYNNLKKNFPKRQEPLLFVMTTAGVVFTFAHEYHIRACKIRDGLVKHPGFHTAIYEADKDGDDFDEEQWRKANPGWDYLNIELLRQEAEEAKRSGTLLSAFKRYHLNKWVAASNTWLSQEQWMKGTECTDHSVEGLKNFREKHLTFEAMRGRRCFVGLDLSANRDTSAAVFVFPPKEKGEREKIIPRVYIPRASLHQRAEKETPLYLDWEEANEIVVTPGTNQDQELIFEDIQSIGKIVKIEGVAYDAHNAGEIVKLMEKSGIKSIAYRQNYDMMNMPMRDIDNRLSQNKIEHGGHPVLSWNIANTEAKTIMKGGGESQMPTKSTDLARIDAVVAMIIAQGFMVTMMSEEEKVSRSVVKNDANIKIKIGGKR